MDTVAHDLHARGEEARENENYLEALKLYEEALISYQKEGNLAGFAEVLSSKFLTYRHLYEQTEEVSYLILAKHSAMASVEIANRLEEREALAIPLYNLAKAHETLGEYEESVSEYKEALAIMMENPPAQHNKGTVLKDMIIHLSVAEYKSGDKSALARAEEALFDLEAMDDSYEKDVWVSGGYMNLAEIIADDDPKKSKEYLDKASKIINKSPKLTIRKKQIQALQDKLFPK